MSAKTPPKPASTAAKEVTYFTSMMRGLLAYQDELERVGSAEKLVAEHEAKIEALMKTEAETYKRMGEADSKAKQRIEDAYAEAAKITAEASKAKAGIDKLVDEAAQHLELAKVSAAQSIADGKAEAKKLVEAGKAKARQIEISAEGMVTAAQAKVGDITKQLADAMAQLESVKTQHQSELKKLSAAKDQVANIRAKLGVLG